MGLKKASRTVRAATGVLPARGDLGVVIDPLPLTRRARNVRQKVQRAAGRLHRTVSIPADRILLGSVAGIDASEFANLHDDVLWTSTPVGEGPHAELLRAAASNGFDSVFDKGVGAFDRSAYGRMAHSIVDSGRSFRGCRSMEDVESAAREYAELSLAGDAAYGGHSGSDAMIEVRPIADSDCYQLVTGTHDAARLVVAGSSHLEVIVTGTPVQTSMQHYLSNMSWLKADLKIYQPLDMPELASDWPLVRSCEDRWAKITSMLPLTGVDDGSTYLDVGACYGWFMSQGETAGLRASGIELDPLAPELGQIAYGLDPKKWMTGDVTEILSGTDETWDMVSCFSVLHHFAIGNGSCSAEELMGLLDKATGKVLFFDTGQDNEKWFRERLKGWNPEFIRRFIMDNSSFDIVVDLGPDSDDTVPFHLNYRRNLFACMRSK